MTMLIVILINVASSIVTGNAQDYAMRLNNTFGNNSKEGRLEIYYSGKWGTVCDDYFTNASARVACNSLGFGYMGAVIDNRYEAGTDPIWLDDVNCTGSETGIEQCVHKAWGVNNCGHHEDVSISCECTSRTFSQRNGKISSPNFPLAYANNLDCNNYIPVRTGQKVSITFLAFATEPCCDSVTITCVSGNYTSTRYSGSQIPAVLTISSCNQVNVYFHTDGGGTYTGFNLTYNVTSDCTDRYFSGSTGQISSPNYPMLYNNNYDCASYITVPSGQTVIITFSAFNLEQGFDWVRITCVSGGNYVSPSYTGSQTLPILSISPCSLVSVYFHTDGSVVNTGFNLTYRITTGCGDRYFSGPTGQISSQNYPMAYNNNQDCLSYIAVSSGQKITITFLEFSTESVNDWVMITCTSGVTNTSLRYSGSQIPPVLTIYSCMQVNVYFHTDAFNTYTGFNLMYNITSDCADRYFSGTTGQIFSPNFPAAYSNNQECFSYITVLAGQNITFTFLTFYTESINDWVTITCTSGVTYTSPRYSGSQIPANLTLNSCTQVKVYFHTDGATTYTGFNLTYNITSGSPCADRNFSGPTGQIWSPNYPMAYSNNQDCSSYITVLTGQKITFTFLAFNTEPVNDWVTISCTSGVFYTTSRYSGSQIPAVLTITSCNQVKVYFHTDSSTTYTGFNIAYNITSDCADRYFNGSSGQISSPNYPMVYNNNYDCSSYITVSSGQTVVIAFLAFNTEYYRDWVTITCESGNVFGMPRYWGDDFPVILAISSCSLVNVHFHTDGYTTYTYTGFSLTYSITSDIVNGGITTKPSNAFPRSDNNDPVIFNCTTSSKYFPWWTMNAQNSNNYTITNSTCGVIISVPYSLWLRTETLGPGSCNLIVTAPANYRPNLAGSFVCRDATLASARAFLAPIDLELRSLKAVDHSTAVIDIVRDDRLIISCNVSFTDVRSSHSLVFTYFLYNGGPYVQIRILRTYWTSQGNFVSSTDSSDTSSASSYVQINAPAGTIPRYTCTVVCDFFSNVSDIVGNSNLEISFRTEPIDVLYWPTEDKMTITGDNNGQIRIHASLSCSVAANPPATYTWIDESNGNITNGSTIIVQHGGIYTCNASNVIRGEDYQQSKSVNLQVIEDDTNQLNNKLAIILGSCLGAAFLIIIIVVVIVFCRKCRKRKSNEASNAGNINNGNEHELHQKGKSNNYEAGFRNNVDLDESDYVNVGGIQRPVSIDTDDYEELNICAKRPVSMYPNEYEELNFGK